MQTFLGFIVFCSLIGLSEGYPKGYPPGALIVASPSTFSKYISDIFLQNRLIQSFILAIQFPQNSPPPGSEKGHFTHGLHVVKVFLPVISVVVTANATVELHLKVRMQVSAQYHVSPLLEHFDAFVDAHFVGNPKKQNFTLGVYRLKYEGCETQLTVAQIICPSYLVKEQVRPLVLDALTATLPDALCEVVETVDNIGLVQYLSHINVLLPIRSDTTLQYQLAALTQITPNFIASELSLLIRKSRRFIPVPSSSQPVTFPSLNGHILCLVITQDTFNGIFSAVIQIQPREFITTPQVFSGSIQLIDAVAILLSHRTCPKCPEKPLLKILLRVVEDLTIILHPSNPHFQIALEIAVAAKDPLGTITDLFIMKAKLKLRIQMVVHDSRLTFHSTLTRVTLLLISSEIGHIPVATLTKLIHLLLEELFIPRFNEALDDGIPLPSPFNIKLDYPKFLILHGSAALCV